MKYKSYNLRNFKEIKQIKQLPKNIINDIKVVSHVLPFKTNNYVIDELINWDNYQSDPMFILNFPQKEMISNKQYDTISSLLKSNVDKSKILKATNKIRLELNPHPNGQIKYNVPIFRNKKLNGIQHKYKNTMLFFPSQGQTCHAYCTFCFRWPQFTSMSNLKFTTNQIDLIIDYLQEHPQITDILITGGDPMVIDEKILSFYINTILDAKISHLQTIRIGTKSLAFWPYRYLTDPDSEKILNLFKKIVDNGIHLAFMAHFSHPKELNTKAVQDAVKKILETGAQIRTQAPVLNHINADSNIWAEMWEKQVNLRMIPYYMFVARNTGSEKFFALPLVKVFDIFQKAYNNISGICRTVRGPIMSANPGKVQITGISKINDKKIFVLNFLQARDKERVKHPFFAEYNPHAKWFTDLKQIY